jgi:hypothetical protein
MPVHINYFLSQNESEKIEVVDGHGVQERVWFPEQVFGEMRLLSITQVAEKNVGDWAHYSVGDGLPERAADAFSPPVLHYSEPQVLMFC